MSEGLRRYIDDPRDPARLPDNLWEACLQVTLVLEHEWRGMVCKHGDVGKHFVCKVRDWKVQIGVLSDVAWSWHFIVKIRKDTDPLAFGFPCRVYREEAANG